MFESIRIVVVSSDAALSDADGAPHDGELHERGRALHVGLLEAGYRIAAVLPADPFLAERIRQLQPDVVIVDSRSDARDAVEHVVLATRDDPRPIVLFAETDDAALAREAVANGVTAYVVQGVQAHHLRSILEVALARFARELRARLQVELAQARTQIEERKLIERAKGVLMQRQRIDEPEAWRRLRKLAMDRGLKVSQVARRVLDATDFLD